MSLDRIEDFFQSKYVLYIILGITIVNLLGYLSMGDFGSITLFILVGILTNFFNKNMGIILVVSLFITNLVVAKEFINKKIEQYKIKESFESKKKEPEEEINITIDQYGDDDNYEASEEIELKKKKNNIDYASTFEQAYEDLEESVGSEGIEGLTIETDDLINKQQDLINNVKQLRPFLKQAEKFLTRYQEFA
tara:strand:- start:5575 stop:6153 length:579 start_codon:yes stop_codon:yes gene_type:complete